ncbi:MAG: hypothetical protein LBQ63_00585 [Deltaproteobacteria bacterium]|jgi:hypothetical protein|nr:hypothetical protein [Deltaproteobacteria bacterium]
MRVDNPSGEELAARFRRLEERAAASGEAQAAQYLDLGTHMVRLLSYSGEFTPHVRKQLAYVLRDRAARCDATLVIWKEKDLDSLAVFLEERCDPRKNLRLRVERLATGRAARPEPDRDLRIFDLSVSRWQPLLNVDPWARAVSAWNPLTNTYYYAVENLEPEEFIKQGHIFVQTFSKLLKSPSSALVHGALIGLGGNGALLCARGQRGKSTLAVRALLDGFDYVSDDYLVLGREAGGLFAWPIYSIITLSPAMYGDLYARLEAKFVSNNARKDKYVFNIGAYHSRFVQRHPVSLCLFPQIVPDPEPSVLACTPAGKGRAIAQLIHSTIAQMGDTHDIAGIKKLADFVRDLPCYQINLCRDIEKNLRCLREFLQSGLCGQQEYARGMLSSRSQPPTLFAGPR